MNADLIKTAIEHVRNRPLDGDYVALSDWARTAAVLLLRFVTENTSNDML
jgi:hypothetical protein